MELTTSTSSVIYRSPPFNPIKNDRLGQKRRTITSEFVQYLANTIDEQLGDVWAIVWVSQSLITVASSRHSLPCVPNK